tara:strand:- start:32 stop:946 length:915 start_codon:yes stop_codon:yes gene_type:complete
MVIRKNIFTKTILFATLFNFCFGGFFEDSELEINTNSFIFNDDTILLEIDNCNISSPKTSDREARANNEVYVVGHAYGKPGEGNFFPTNLTSFFDLNLTKNSKNYIALNGDFVRIASNQSFDKVKNYIDQNFDGYFISVGNHEIANNLEYYYNFFDRDFFYQEFNNFLLISANFSNNNWLPSEKQIAQINQLIENTNKKNIILLSHQIFWIEETDNEINPNSDDLLNTSLEADSLGWIKSAKNKNFIVISGDYGAWGDTTYCKIKDNKLFIANGIGNSPNDSIIKIHDYEKSFLIEEINLAKEN